MAGPDPFDGLSPSTPSRLLERMADGADPEALAPPAVLRARGDRRRRRHERVLIGVLVSSVVLVVLAAGSLLEDRSTHPEPVSPPAAAASGLIYAPLGVGANALERLAPDGHRTTVLSRLALLDACGGCSLGAVSWSPDGRRAAVVMDSMHGLPDGRIVGANDVWLLERGALRHLFTCPGASRPGCDLEHGSSLSWSPDGTRLALASEQRMYVADASSGRLEPLPGCADCTGESPTWSPDGTSVGFRRGDGIWVVPPAGGAPERVAAIDGPSSFAWSPDGSRLVVGATDGIHLVDLVGGTTRTVFPQADEEGPGDPTWSPDGDRIAWFSTPRVRGAFTAQLWVGDGSGGTTLLRGFGCCVADWEGPLWSPDGRQIALFLDLPRRDELNRSYDLGRRVRVRVVDATTGSIVRTLPGYRPIGWPEPGERATP